MLYMHLHNAYLCMNEVASLFYKMTAMSTSKNLIFKKIWKTDPSEIERNNNIRKQKNQTFRNPRSGIFCLILQTNVHFISPNVRLPTRRSFALICINSLEPFSKPRSAGLNHHLPKLSFFTVPYCAWGYLISCLLALFSYEIILNWFLRGCI